MYHVVKISGKFKSVDVSNLQDDDKSERIQDYINEGTPVIIVNDLSDLFQLGIDEEEVSTWKTNI